jgi:hypothetical protein
MRKWLKEKKDRFLKSRVLSFLLGAAIIGSSIIIYYEGMPLYRYIKEGYQYSTKFIQIQNQSEVVHQGGTLVSADAQEQSYISSEIVSPQNDIEGLITRYFGSDSKTALAVAKCESQLNPTRIGDTHLSKPSVGLFQISQIYHNYTTEQLLDAEFNCKIAKEILDNGGWNRWTCYRTGSYNKFL